MDIPLQVHNNSSTGKTSFEFYLIYIFDSNVPVPVYSYFINCRCMFYFQV